MPNASNLQHPTSIKGTWALVATEWKRADGKHANPFGANALGIVIYDGAGNMSAQVMHEGRTQPPATQPSGIDTAMASATPGYIAYFGTYAVDEAAWTIAHHVAGSAYPAWVGLDITRRFKIEGNRLTMSASVVTSDGVAAEAATIWERVG
ncbi:MAG: lipocalin-like domain-containing protein [Chloroflexota bacterium]|nr:lipocalin-like domain-containing protein [Chloroflexota bacterium]